MPLVDGYRNLPDAATKLNVLAGPTSPLLALFFTISHNTAVANAAVANAVFNATGVRVRDFPITIEKLLAGLPLLEA